MHADMPQGASMFYKVVKHMQSCTCDMAPYLGSGATYQIDMLYYLRNPPPFWGAGGRSLTGKFILMEGFKELL